MKYFLRAASATWLLLLSADIFACLNLYVINERGQEGIYDFYPPYHIHMSPQSDLKTLGYYEKDIKEGKKDFRTISNYAVYLIKLGHNKEALAILKKLSKQKPGEYEILANLATAYELNGEPDSALKYMRQSLKINPDSHNGSEWFHIRFLEATLEHRDKNTNIDALDILKLDTASSQATAYELSHQLEERIPLTSGPNAMLSKVLEESGDYFRKIISVDFSVKLYAMAIGFSDNENASKRLWEKLETARAKVVELDKVKRKNAGKDEVRKQLLSSKWKTYIQKDIDRWKTHKAHYEKDLTILNP